MTSREKWLLGILSGIFIIQAGTFVWGLNHCASVEKPLNIADVCPEIGRRYETTFANMISTTLALLTGSAVIGPAVAKSREKDRPLPPTPPTGRQ